MRPRVLILRAPGTNCDEESQHAFRLAGGDAERVHVNRLLERPALLDEYQIICLPGGFSYGDDLAAGRILGSQLKHHLFDAIKRFRDAGKLVLGICNGFQILIKSGVLLEDDPAAGPAATLTWNASGRFEDRWIHVAVTANKVTGNKATGNKVTGNKSVFLAGIDSMYLPIAHAEGKFVGRDKATLDALRENGQLVLRYAGDAGAAASDEPLPFPMNPNGSVMNVAGVCDETGRVLGLMPHPERHVDPTQHPRWTRGEANDPADGLRLFQNAVRYFR
jgi:phosphoribosylformylglycinamidine synthase